MKDEVAAENAKLKQPPGKDWFIFGSADLASPLTKRGLIDEYRVTVNPVVLGKGEPLFNDVKAKLNLKLVNTKTFRSGNVLLFYEPNRN